MSKSRIFAGEKLRALRQERGMRQAELATQLGISASYLSQLEHDDRPLPHALAQRLRASFPIDWVDLTAGGVETLVTTLRDAAADPIFRGALPADSIQRVTEQYPAFAQQFAQLYDRHRRDAKRLELLDEALGASSGASAGDGGRLPWEEVRDWFQLANNYVDQIDCRAEELSLRLSQGLMTPDIAQFEQEFARQGVIVDYVSSGPLRHFSPLTNTLHINRNQPTESLRFNLAYQLASMELQSDIRDIVGRATLKTGTAKQLLSVGLGNYAAGAVLMPYHSFRGQARKLRHDIDRIRLIFSTSFEQACHRLSTLQRPGARGVPVFFCRVDMAGNITKRHSATRLQFARFGGACPLWVVHEAVAIPDRILVQAAQLPDGERYVSIAKGLVKPSGSYAQLPRRYAVALGCEAQFASEFVYADTLNLDNAGADARIGVSCRICPRTTCEQRAFPPSDRPILVDQDVRHITPYEIAD